MADRLIQASKFKATCLALIDDVAENGQAYIVTKRGRPVARLVPIDDEENLAGSVTVTIAGDDLLSTGETWRTDA